MIALCREHHDAADAGQYSTADLRNMKQSPNKFGEVLADFDCWAKRAVLMRCATNYFSEPKALIRLGDYPLVQCRRGENNLLNFSFDVNSPSGVTLLHMEDNMFFCDPAEVYDLEMRNGKQFMKVWFGKRDVGLDLSFQRMTEEKLLQLVEKDALTELPRKDYREEAEAAIEMMERGSGQPIPEERKQGLFEFYREIEEREKAKAGTMNIRFRDHVMGWAIQNCMDDDKKIPVLNFNKLKGQYNGRIVEFSDKAAITVEGPGNSHLLMHRMALFTTTNIVHFE